jgi:hypothetical protein
MTTTESNRTTRSVSGAHVSDGSTGAGEQGIGWIVFAGIVLAVAGLMRILDAIWAFSYHGALPDSLKDGALGSDLKTYGWLWLAVGCVLILCGLGVLFGRSQIARWIGMIAAGIAIVTSAVWLPYYPVWSFVYVALGGMTLYALAAYGGPEPAA